MSSTALTPVAQSNLPAAVAHAELATFYIGEQPFGIPVAQVQDVLNPQIISPVPLSPPYVAGLINLRGRVVTAIDMRNRLGLPARDSSTCMNVVVEHEDELYSLLVDSAGDVLNLPSTDFELPPPTLDSSWRQVSTGIFRLQEQLLVVLECERLLSFSQNQKDS